MRKRRFIAGIISLALVFGMALSSCYNPAGPSTGGNNNGGNTGGTNTGGNNNGGDTGGTNTGGNSNGGDTGGTNTGGNNNGGNTGGTNNGGNTGGTAWTPPSNPNVIGGLGASYAKNASNTTVNQVYWFRIYVGANLPYKIYVFDYDTSLSLGNNNYTADVVSDFYTASGAVIRSGVDDASVISYTSPTSQYVYIKCTVTKGGNFSVLFE